MSDLDPIDLPEKTAHTAQHLRKKIRRLQQRLHVYLQGFADSHDLDLRNYELDPQDSSRLLPASSEEGSE